MIKSPLAARGLRQASRWDTQRELLRCSLADAERPSYFDAQPVVQRGYSCVDGLPMQGQIFS
jgi:hypothetical protein